MNTKQTLKTLNRITTIVSAIDSSKFDILSIALDEYNGPTIHLASFNQLLSLRAALRPTASDIRVVVRTETKYPIAAEFYYENVKVFVLNTKEEADEYGIDYSVD